MAALVAAPAAAAQGGVTAPDLSDPCPAVYPGDSASQERLARWMARSAADRGLPRELPVMAAIAESGLRNLRGEDYHGFFGMHESLNAGVYRGFPSRPELQLRWFLDSAAAVRQRRIAEGMPDPAADERDFGLWVADVERPAPQNRSGYQPHLAEAQAPDREPLPGAGERRHRAASAARRPAGAAPGGGDRDRRDPSALPAGGLPRRCGARRHRPRQAAAEPRERRVARGRCLARAHGPGSARRPPAARTRAQRARRRTRDRGERVGALDHGRAPGAAVPMTFTGALRRPVLLEAVARDTGLPSADAQFDFSRARRRRALSRLSQRMRREPSDVNVILPFEEVVAALGQRGERRLGQQTIELDSIVGTVDRRREFDRRFRPTSGRGRQRWERIAAAQRRGEAMPPIDVYRIGELHFVKDGHHRVSVARELGHRDINAYVTEIVTQVGPDREIRMSDLPLKSHERLFFERVPLGAEQRKRIQLSDEWRYAALAEAVEAWGFRAMQGRGELMSRAEVAESWFRNEYEPVVELLREADLVRSGSETESYMRVSHLRYLLLRTHEWDDAVIDAVRRDLESPGGLQDTMVHRLRRELK